MGLTKPTELNLLSYQGTFMYLKILYEGEFLMKCYQHLCYERIGI